MFTTKSIARTFVSVAGGAVLAGSRFGGAPNPTRTCQVDRNILTSDKGGEPGGDAA